MIVLISQVLGTEDLMTYIEKYKMPVQQKIIDRLDYYEKRDLSCFVTSKNKHLANPEALDLLSKFLVYDQEYRITAKEAMKHPYFKPFWK